MAKKGKNCGVSLTKNCGDVYIFAVGPYSYRKTRPIVRIAIVKLASVKLEVSNCFIPPTSKNLCD